MRLCYCLASWFVGFFVGLVMTARIAGWDSLAGCQNDICGSSVSLRVALFLPQRHQWDPHDCSCGAHRLSRRKPPISRRSHPGECWVFSEPEWRPRTSSPFCYQCGTHRHFCLLQTQVWEFGSFSSSAKGLLFACFCLPMLMAYCCLMLNMWIAGNI